MSASESEATETPAVSGLTAVLVVRGLFLLALLGSVVALFGLRPVTPRPAEMPGSIPLATHLGGPALAAASPATASPTTQPEPEAATAEDPEPAAPDQGKPATAASTPSPVETRSPETAATAPAQETPKAAPAASPAAAPSASPSTSEEAAHAEPTATEAEPTAEAELITGPVANANLVIYVRHRCLLLRAHAKILRTCQGIGIPAALTRERKPTATRDYRIHLRETRDEGPVLAIDMDGATVLISGHPEPATGPADQFLLLPGAMDEVYRAVTTGTHVLVVP